LNDSEELRQRLERLGVRLGFGNRPATPGPAAGTVPEPPRPLPAPPRDRIEDWVSGHEVETAAGACFLSETRYPLLHVHGEMPLGALLEQDPAALAVLAGNMDAPDGFSRLAFLDTETTGLAGGTGTYAFLVGLGVYEGDDFVVRQYFMRDIPEERALLGLVASLLADRTGLVTFNGRTFDWPLLETRFAMHRMPPPAVDGYHLDLLPLARRLWRQRLTSCALSSLEQNVLNVGRSEADVPGWAIPGLYLDFLTWGRAEPLRGVFYHNAHDIISLATLATLMCRAVRSPLEALQHGEDLFSLGKRYETLGDVATAVQLYEHSLRSQMPKNVRHTVLHHLGQIHKRAGRPAEAVTLWCSLAEHGDCEACIELAKHYEHREGDLAQARAMSEKALHLLRQHAHPDRTRMQEVEHRLQRLADKERRKQACHQAGDSSNPVGE
jgi:uncharacterized protein